MQTTSAMFRMQRGMTAALLLLTMELGLPGLCQTASTALDLSKATLVVRSGVLPPAEQTAAHVLVEEVERRTGFRWPISTAWPKRGVVIAISREMNLPVRYVGVGEKQSDLIPFNAVDFVDSLFA